MSIREWMIRTGHVTPRPSRRRGGREGGREWVSIILVHQGVDKAHRARHTQAYRRRGGREGGREGGKERVSIVCRYMLPLFCPLSTPSNFFCAILLLFISSPTQPSNPVSFLFLPPSLPPSLPSSLPELTSTGVAQDEVASAVLDKRPGDRVLGHLHDEEGGREGGREGRRMRIK